MKILSIILLAVVPLLISCREDIVEFDDIQRDGGSIYLTSFPSGAEILFHDGRVSELKTPEKFDELEPGDYVFTLRLAGYKDTTIVAKAESGENKYFNILLKRN